MQAADLFKQDINRPIDAVTKEAIKRDGVAGELYRTYAGRDELLAVKIPGNIKWLDQEFRPKQETWRADKFGEISDTHVLHVEPQTSHSWTSANMRMMNYAAFITTHYKMRKQVRQVYYYTGDDPLKGGQRVEVDNQSPRCDHKQISVD